MTKEQYEKTREQFHYLSNGSFLSMMIRGILNNLDLTLRQYGTVEEVTGGKLNPSSTVMYKSVLEILELGSLNKIDELITNLKRLPSPKDGASEVIYLFNGKPCSKGVYFSSDRDFLDGRWKEGTPRPKRSRANFQPMSEEAFKQIQEDFKERWADREPIIHQPRETPIPVYDEQEDKPIYNDIGDTDDEDTLTEEQEFEHNEPSKAWVNRPKKGDTDE